jgi:tRNA A-37 threonylcarbamoyl transferase component Bud32
MSAKEGYLSKQGGALKRWKKRWFVLDGQRLVYSEKPGKKENGAIDLAHLGSVTSAMDGKRPVLKLNVIGQKTYVLAGETAKEVDEWVAALSNIAKAASAAKPAAAAAGAAKPAAAASAGPPAHKPTIDDYLVLSVLGKGSFGTVQLVRSKLDRQLYAMKMLDKRVLQETDQVGQTLTERDVLFKLQHPFCVAAHATFQTPDMIVMVLDYIPGGELFGRLKEEGNFNESRARLYAAELALALGHLHAHGFVYRDLKPENILVDRQGHLKITDFGLVKPQMTDANATTNTFCGTPEYIAPEILQQQPYTKSVDWWSFGIVLYEMLAGIPPFYDENTNRMYRRIIQEAIKYPADFPPKARDLVGLLCDRNPSTRLGASERDVEEIKAHPFFEGLSWERVFKREYTPEWVPQIANEQDTQFFDQDALDGPSAEVAAGTVVRADTQNQFVGFTCTDDTLIGGM